MKQFDNHLSPDSFSGFNYNRLFGTPTSSAWSLSSSPEKGLHRIHSYPAKFPALVVEGALKHARERNIEVRRVADVFCGSGTVGLEAAYRGLEFWGCDINPVATLIARVKNSWLDPIAFRRTATRIASAYAASPTLVAMSESASERLRYWFEDGQFRDLAKLLNAIRAEVGSEGDEAMAFACAFSAIIKPASLWRNRSTKPSRDPNKAPIDVIGAFQRQCAMMAAGWAESAPELRPASVIRHGCATSIPFPEVPVDLIVTSPPYAISYEYADLHQLSALWLGLVDDHRQLRENVIGTGSKRANLSKAVRELNGVALQIVFSLFEKDRALAEGIAAYFLDMQKVARRCHDLLRPGGLAVFVIGNTQLRGIRIDNANHLVESLLEAQFHDLRIVKRQLANKPNTPYRTPTGKLSSLPTDMSIYAEEYILMAQRL